VDSTALAILSSCQGALVAVMGTGPWARVLRDLGTPANTTGLWKEPALQNRRARASASFPILWVWAMYSLQGAHRPQQGRRKEGERRKEGREGVWVRPCGVHHGGWGGGGDDDDEKTFTNRYTAACSLQGVRHCDGLMAVTGS
jgi:hypothetical protein